MSREILIEFKKYETEFAGILYRFKRNRDGIWIGEGDDPILRQYVREITDLCNEVFGKNTYSIQISAEFDNGVGNIFGTPSFKSVENILSVVRAVITRLNCHPELLVQKKEPETGSDQAPVDSVLGICNRFHEVARQLVH